mmetsp:Transcript_12998/g.33005  ORF Transcript_12998/g.33005 Transcript_12998/m.33005 type:complete len:143 (+) Transcript_12998:140-568(+)
MLVLTNPRSTLLHLLVFVAPVARAASVVPAVARAARLQSDRGLALATRQSAGAVACSANDRSDTKAAEAADALIAREKAAKEAAEAAENLLAEAVLHDQVASAEEATVIDAGELSEAEMRHHHHLQEHILPHIKRSNVRMAS